MGRAAAVLSGRLAAFAAVVAALGAYFGTVHLLPALPLWADVLVVALGLYPASFALAWVALPLRRVRGVGLLGAALALVAVAWHLAGLDVASNFAKLAAASLLALWFLGYFERASWVAIVALAIPIVDAFSVWRGPTRHIVTEEREIFDALSYTVPVPGGGAFDLGLPDVLFFTLFLAAAARFRLRVSWTWTAMLASFGVTMALAIWVDPFGIGGLPALPGLSLAFLAVNGDLLWREIRPGR